LATDRIDIASSVNEIVSFNYAVPFASQLLVFSDRHQFMIFYGDEGLTPNNSSLALISSYEASPNCRPVSLNNSIIFAQNKSDSVAVYELMPSGGRNLTFDGRNITSHVPSYIKGKAISLAGSSLSNAVILQTDDTDGELYLYNFFDQEGKRVRSSWSKIKLAADYVHPPHLAYNPPTSSIADNDPSSGKSKITMEWRIADSTSREANIIVFDKSTGTEYAVDTANSTNEYVVVTGAIGSNANIIVGLKFTANYEFSKQYLKRQAADGVMAPIIDGRTVVKWAEVYFTNTQYLKAEVKFDTLLKRTNHEKVFTNTFASGAVTTNYGDLNSETERMRIMVASRNTAVDSITLTTDTYQIATITGATFELLHTSRLTRLS
jgi:hypothetical protein